MSAIERGQPREALEELRARLRAAQEALDSVRGEVDAIVVEGSAGTQVYTVVNADQPYRTIVEEMEQGALVLTPAGDIFYCNRGFENMVRMRLDEVVGLPMTEFLAGADEAGLEQLVAAGTGTLETVLRASDGTEVPAYVSAGRFGGTPTHVCLVVTDLTEQKRQAAREALFAKEEAARAEAEAANRAKDQFLNMLSHELRNPLGVILNGIEVLNQTSSMEPGPVKIREIIRRQAQHLGKLLDDLLDVARVGQGKIDLRHQAIDLADVDRLPDVVATAESAFGGVAVWLHDHEIAAVAADNDAVEGVSRVDGAPAIPLHMLTLRDMGMPLGEGFYLEELAADCADDGVYECMLVAPALRATGGVGSPVNPLAMK